MQPSERMQKPLPCKLLLRDYTFQSLDEEGVKAALGQLRNDNFRMTVVSKVYSEGWDRAKVEEWYGTKYKLEKIPKDFLVSSELDWTNLQLPKENPFIPTKLKVEKKGVERPSAAPILVRNDKSTKVWFKDDTFGVPKERKHHP
jgi:insulysin